MDNLSPPELLQRIDALVVQATGLAVDADRMHTDALYARDVLLVCDAVVDSDGPALAKRFRALQTIARDTGEALARPRRSPVATPTRAERRARGLRDRRRQRMRLPAGRERRRGPRRSADAERAPSSAPVSAPVPAPAPAPAPKAAAVKTPPPPRIFSAIFGNNAPPPAEERSPEPADPATPPRRWFGRRSDPR